MRARPIAAALRSLVMRKQIRGWHSEVAASPFTWRVPWYAAEEEQLVLHDWSTDRSAELVLLQSPRELSRNLQERIVRVEHVVAEELPQRAVNTVRFRSW